jgi:class 3 adenylate cyclase
MMREDTQQPTATELAPNHRLGLPSGRARIPDMAAPQPVRPVPALPDAHQPWEAATIPLAGVPFTAVIMFVDIRDSTTLTNVLGIVPMTRLVTHFFTRAAFEIEDSGGSVCAFNGDGALALFRGPSAADRSVGAAIRILELACATPAPDVRAGSSAPAAGHLIVGIGIDKGPVCQAVIRCSASPQQSWVGVNTAYKLASLGPQSPSIVVTEGAATDMTDERGCGPLALSSDGITRIGGIDLAVRTFTMQPAPGHAES